MGLNFPLGSLINPLMTFKTKSPTCSGLGLTRFLKARAIFLWYARTYGLFLSPTHFLITLSTLILSFQTFNSYLIYSFEISNNGWSRPCLDDPHFFINSFVLTFWITICGNDSFLKFCEILTVWYYSKLLIYAYNIYD